MLTCGVMLQQQALLSYGINMKENDMMSILSHLSCKGHYLQLNIGARSCFSLSQRHNCRALAGDYSSARSRGRYPLSSAVTHLILPRV